MTKMTQTQAAILAARHVSAFNDSVTARDFSYFLTLFTDDAVIRFENVPGADDLEYAGRPAYSKAYDERPPDDEIDITARAKVAGGDTVVVPFAWRRGGPAGTMRLAYTDGDSDDLDDRLVTAMTVKFGSVHPGSS
jgi:hypothetical protein